MCRFAYTGVDYSKYFSELKKIIQDSCGDSEEVIEQIENFHNTQINQEAWMHLTFYFAFPEKAPIVPERVQILKTMRRNRREIIYYLFDHVGVKKIVRWFEKSYPKGLIWLMDLPAKIKSSDITKSW